MHVKHFSDTKSLGFPSLLGGSWHKDDEEDLMGSLRNCPENFDSVEGGAIAGCGAGTGGGIYI